eukprot:gnl/TRDRNA2_/TRDRNA2_117260_c1_seq1.p1 gnl/TRDRNA2_/TRDRNA2_117260_c1~~gnl/TRDRNA2_/TRDRNA2_117260_c1_seq1.p1  ORF type:complete len:113 (-),score=20.17 gnl/TRDRNA2_/TRDRNA2_117260_c1_seq1:54-392(-)
MIVDSCSGINTLLEADSPLLLGIAAEIELNAASSSSRRVSDAVPSMLAELLGQSSQGRHAASLITLEQWIATYDDVQALFGIPITSKMRTGLLTSLGLYFLSFLWDVMGNVI